MYKLITENNFRFNDKNNEKTLKTAPSFMNKKK